jgi:heme/copper-type cytochrome/quinol oxidase subunit 1
MQTQSNDMKSEGITCKRQLNAGTYIFELINRLACWTFSWSLLFRSGPLFSSDKAPKLLKNLWIFFSPLISEHSSPPFLRDIFFEVSNCFNKLMKLSRTNTTLITNIILRPISFSIDNNGETKCCDLFEKTNTFSI